VNNLASFGPAQPQDMNLEGNETSTDTLDRDRERDRKRLDNITKILAEMANTQDLSSNNKQALLELGRQSGSKSYRERAKLAMSAVGLKVDKPDVFKTVPALCNPMKSSEEKRVKYTLVEGVKSRVTAAWRSMAGLKGEDKWDPDSDVPPPNPTKFNKGITRPNLREADYALSSNPVLCDKGLTVENKFSVKPDSSSSITLSRLVDWEKTLNTSLSVINMIDVFSSSIDRDTDSVLEVLEACNLDSLPTKLKDLLADKERIKADKESRARALQHITSLLSYLLTDNILLRRDCILAKSDLKMSENTKTVLRLQPLKGQYLFNGRVDDLLKKDAQAKTTDLVLKLSDNLMGKKTQNAFTSLNKGNDYKKKDNQSYQSTSGSQKGRSNNSFRNRGRNRSHRRNRNNQYFQYNKRSSANNKGAGDKKST
jgi:hypothetical protein